MSRAFKYTVNRAFYNTCTAFSERIESPSLYNTTRFLILASEGVCDFDYTSRSIEKNCKLHICVNIELARYIISGNSL